MIHIWSPKRIGRDVRPQMGTQTEPLRKLQVSIPAMPTTVLTFGLFLLVGCAPSFDRGPDLFPLTNDAKMIVDLQPVGFVLTAAQKQAGRFLERIGQDRMAEFGLVSATERDRLLLGPPVQMLFFQPDQLPKILPSQTWRVPLVVGTEWRLLVTVTCRGSDCQVVEIGAAGLAKEIQHVGEGWPLIQLGLLRAISLGGDFLISNRRARPLTTGQRLLAEPKTAVKELDLVELGSVLEQIGQAQGAVRPEKKP